MQTEVAIAADSVNAATGDRITTFILNRFPKCLQAQLNTHRMLSKNSASSRAVPIEKMINKVTEDPFIPSFTANKPGMEGSIASEDQILKAKALWIDSMNCAIESTKALAKLGIHKQEANRLLEPFMKVPIIITATEWENFFTLRCNHDSQPDFQRIALLMRKEYLSSAPSVLSPGEWHFPFGDNIKESSFVNAIKIATARCARISYMTHTGEIDSSKDLELHDRLFMDAHRSPFEHCAQAIKSIKKCRNFDGWRQYRDFVEVGESVL